MKQKIIVLGAGGHAKVVIDAINKSGNYKIAGLVLNDKIINEHYGIKVIGADSDLEHLFKHVCKNAIVAVGSIGNPSVRINLAMKLKKIGFRLPSIIHPSAIIAGGVEIKDGTFIAAGSIIGPDSRIGENVIVNSGSSIDHDCIVDDFAHIAPGVFVSGGVHIEERVHIGIGSCIRENVKVGRNSLIGAGSVVISDIPENRKAYGNPCKAAGVNNA